MKNLAHKEQIHSIPYNISGHYHTDCKYTHFSQAVNFKLVFNLPCGIFILKQIVKMLNSSPTTEIQKAVTTFLRLSSSSYFLPIDFDTKKAQFKLLKVTKKHKTFSEINSTLIFSLCLIMLFNSTDELYFNPERSHHKKIKNRFFVGMLSST